MVIDTIKTFIQKYCKKTYAAQKVKRNQQTKSIKCTVKIVLVELTMGEIMITLMNSSLTLSVAGSRNRSLYESDELVSFGAREHR